MVETFTYIDVNKDIQKPSNEFNYVDSYSIGEPSVSEPPENSIDIGTNFDGSKKYSFDTIYKDKELIKVAKEFYGERDGLEFDDDQDVVDEFISDRTWKQANITSAGKELYQVKNTLSPEQLKRLSYLTSYWRNLPSFYEEGGRSAVSSISHNLMAGVLDLTNVASLGLGAIVTKTLGKKVVTEYAKKNIQRQILKTTAKATAVTTAFDASIFAAGDLAIQEAERELGLRTKFDLKRTGLSAIFGGGLSILPNGLANYGVLKMKYDIFAVPKEPASPTLKKVLTEIDEETGQTKTVIREDIDVKELDKTITGRTKTKKLFVQADEKKPFLWWMSRIKQGLFDDDNVHKLFQYAYTGVKASSKALKPALDAQLKATPAVKKLLKEGRDSEIGIEFLDPGQLNANKRKEISATTLRSDDFLQDGVKVFRNVIGKDPNLPNYGKIIYEPVPTGNKGLESVIKPYDDAGEGEMFVRYALAKRSQGILLKNERLLSDAKKTGSKIPDLQDTPFTPKEAMSQNKRQQIAKEKIQEILDYGELTPDQYRVKYKYEGRDASSPSFIEGMKGWKAFFDDLLDYAQSRGLHDAKAVAIMKADSPYGYIPMQSLKGMEHVAYEAGTSRKIVGVEGAGTSKKRKTFVSDRKAKQKTTLAPLLRTSIDYTYNIVKASDANARKVAFYNQLDKVPEVEAKYIAQLASTEQVKGVKVFTKSVIKELERKGIKIDSSFEKQLAELDEKMFAMATTSTVRNDATGDLFDVVYRNMLDAEGNIKNVRQIYSIKSALLQDSLETLGPALSPFLQKTFSIMRYAGRLPARAITYSPPFVAFNFIRDSLSATVNSSFGVHPLMAVRGFQMTFAGNKNGKNMEKLVNGFRRNDEFRKALISGMGQSTRKDVELYGGVNNIDSFGSNASSAWYKKTLNHMRGNIFGRGARGYAEFVSRVEYANRLAEYTAAKKMGLSSTAAAIAGREVSTDFAMKGSSKLLQRYASVTMFLNAGIQGFYRGARIFLEGEGVGKGSGVNRIALRRAKKDISQGAVIDRLKDVNTRALLYVGGTIVAPELLLHMHNRDLPEYQDVPDEVKMLNYLWPNYVDEKEDGSHLHSDGTRKVEYFMAMPKPYDFGFFANVATGIYEGVMKKSPGMAADYIMTSLFQVVPGLAAPTLANPWIHLMMNKNWLGDEILPQGYRKLPAELQIKSNTRKSAVIMSQFIKKFTSKGKQIITGSGEKVYTGITISPVKLDYIMSGYFTGIASYPLDIMDALTWDKDKYGERATSRGDVENLVNPNDLLKSEPWSIVTRRFKVEVPIKNAKPLQLFYDIRNKAKKLKTGVSYNSKDLSKVLGLEVNEDLEYTEIKEALAISPWLETVAMSFKKNRDYIKKIKLTKDYNGFPDVPRIEYKDMSEADIKKKDIDFLMQLNNDVANSVLIDLRDLNFETIDRDIFGYTKYDDTKPFKKNKLPTYNKDSKFLK